MQYKVQRVIRETDDAISLVLDAVGEVIQYEAGQFITFIFKNRNGEEERRSYSISSAPILNEPLMVTIKKVTNGTYSRQLVDRTVSGDLLMGIGPSGYFTLPSVDERKDHFAFFAAGSGITPIFALIKTLLATHKRARVVLVYSNKSKRDTLFYDQLLSLHTKYADQFSIRFLFSDAARFEDARLSAGTVERIVQQYFKDHLNESLFYLCGPFHYMLTITLVLRGMGVLDAQIRKEQFVIEKTMASQKPPDTEEHTVSVQLNGETFKWTTQYPDTILQAAKKKGIALPYSCESGQCGACSATCIEGEVWMYKNEVLMDEELELNRVLTCTGFPIGGDIKLVYDATHLNEGRSS